MRQQELTALVRSELWPIASEAMSNFITASARTSGSIEGKRKMLNNAREALYLWASSSVYAAFLIIQHDASLLIANCAPALTDDAEQAVELIQKSKSHFITERDKWMNHLQGRYIAMLQDIAAIENFATAVVNFKRSEGESTSTTRLPPTIQEVQRLSVLPPLDHTGQQMITAVTKVNTIFAAIKNGIVPEMLGAMDAFIAATQDGRSSSENKRKMLSAARKSLSHFASVCSFAAAGAYAHFDQARWGTSNGNQWATNCDSFMHAFASASISAAASTSMNEAEQLEEVGEMAQRVAASIAPFIELSWVPHSHISGRGGGGLVVIEAEKTCLAISEILEKIATFARAVAEHKRVEETAAAIEGAGGFASASAL